MEITTRASLWGLVKGNAKEGSRRRPSREGKGKWGRRAAGEVGLAHRDDEDGAEAAAPSGPLEQVPRRVPRRLAQPWGGLAGRRPDPPQQRLPPPPPPPPCEQTPSTKLRSTPGACPPPPPVGRRRRRPRRWGPWRLRPPRRIPPYLGCSRRRGLVGGEGNGWGIGARRCWRLLLLLLDLRGVR